MSVRMLGIYTSAHAAAAAAAALRAGGFTDVTAYSPTPDHAIEEAVGGGVSPPSPVRTFVLAGGLIGCVTGFAFPIYTVLDWPLITGGKPLISVPPFVIIAFELTILFGALSGVLGFLISAGVPRFRPSGLYDPRFSEDRYGVQVGCPRERMAVAESILTAEGAEEVRHEK